MTINIIIIIIKRHHINIFNGILLKITNYNCFSINYGYKVFNCFKFILTITVYLYNKHFYDKDLFKSTFRFSLFFASFCNSSLTANF